MSSEDSIVTTITLSPRAETIAAKRLYLKNLDGMPIEDFSGMCKRVAKHLANSPEEYHDFLEVMLAQEFLPNSPCLVNAGVEGRPNQLSGCFVLDVPDSLDAIMDTVKEVAMIHKSGGGTGMPFSDIRPKNAIVASTSGVASGPISFMKIFDATTEQVKQGGVRRGANMGVLRVDHPDILEFINCKKDKISLQNFNLSVGITEKFMQALEVGGYYDLVDPHSGSSKPILAKTVFEAIVDCAHESGEPGLLFLDRINHHNPLKGVVNYIKASNPCGEQPLSPDEACGLGSVNLAVMVVNGQVNFEKLRKVVTIAVTMLNRMMMKSEYPNAKIRAKVDYSRKIGLGPMGLADLLIKLKIPYSSPDAVEIAENIAIVMQDSAVLATHKLGIAEGVFPAFATDYEMPLHIIESLSRLGIATNDYTPANSTLTTVAPTGTISMIAECSASIEPIYKFVQFENRADTIIEHHHPLYAKWKELYPNAPIPTYYEEAHDITPQQHIAIQAIFQKYTCSGVSKTINLPSHASKKDVADAYFLAYRSGCKGITVYRDGSLDNQVLSGSMPSGAASNSNVIVPLDRPKALKGDTYQIKTGYGEMLVTVNYLNGKPFEILCTLGKSGASEMAKAEGISRLCSILLRCGVSPDIIVGQLEGIKGSTPVHTELGLVESIPDAISKVITHYVLDNSHSEKSVPAMMKCSDCGKSHGLVKVGSCIKCTICGWESCGG